MAIKSIQVEILNRTYPLRVDEESEAFMRELAEHVNQKMTAFQEAYREQSEITTAVITALAIAEELHTARREHGQELDEVDAEVDKLTARLEESLRE